MLEMDEFLEAWLYILRDCSELEVAAFDDGVDQAFDDLESRLNDVNYLFNVMIHMGNGDPEESGCLLPVQDDDGVWVFQ